MYLVYEMVSEGQRREVRVRGDLALNQKAIAPFKSACRKWIDRMLYCLEQFDA